MVRWISVSLGCLASCAILSACARAGGRERAYRLPADIDRIFITATPLPPLEAPSLGPPVSGSVTDPNTVARLVGEIDGLQPWVPLGYCPYVSNVQLRAGAELELYQRHGPPIAVAISRVACDGKVSLDGKYQRMLTTTLWTDLLAALGVTSEGST